MIDNGPVDGFVKKLTQTTVLVRTPAADTIGETLHWERADVELRPDRVLVVSGIHAPPVGELAHREGIVLHEPATHSASMEQAFIPATGESEEFVEHEFTPRSPHRPMRSLRTLTKQLMTCVSCG